MTRAFRFVSCFGGMVAVALACACGGGPETLDASEAMDAPEDAAPDDAPTEDASAPEALPTLALTSERIAVRPGETVALAWSVTHAEGLALVLRAIEPGPPVASSGPRGWSPGVAPATGAVRWLAPDGRWASAPETFASSAEPGARAVTLPTDTEGEWAFEAILEQAGQPVVVSVVRVLVTRRPAVRLWIDRLAAGPDDPVRAELTTARGALPADVQVLAWLVGPDGTETMLPEGTAGGSLLHDGPAEDARHLLLARDFAGEVSGTYRVAARMVDPHDGATLGLAEASFTVCAGTSRVEGMARHADGTPLRESSGASLAWVVAQDLGDGRRVSGPLRADGGYALELGAGTYVVVAVRVDASGRHQAVSVPFTVGGACEAGLTVDLSVVEAASGSEEVGRLVGRTPRAVPLSARVSSDGLPTPRLRVLYQGSLPGRALSADEEVLTDVFFSELLGRVAPDVDMVTAADLQAIAGLRMNQLLIGGEADLDLRTLFADDFLLFVRFNRTGSRATVQARLVDVRTDLLLGARELDSRSDSASMLDAVERLAATVASDLRGGGPPLLALLREAQPCPLVPQLALEELPDLAAGSARLVTVRATLTDLNRRACGGRPVLLFHRAAGAPAFRMEVAETDSAGVAEAMFVSPGVPGVEPYYARFEDGVVVAERPPRSYRVLEPEGRVSVEPARVVARRGAALPVEVRVRGGDLAPQAGDDLAYVATLGRLSAASGTTDSSGRAGLELAVGAEEPLGVGVVSAMRTAAPEITGRAAYLVTDAATLSLTAGSSALVSGGTTSLSGTVQIADGAAPGVAVHVSVAGGGEASPSRVVTGAAGEYRVEFQAPAGTGRSVVTAAVVVDGQRITRSVELSYDPAPPPVFPADAGEWMGECQRYSLCGDPPVELSASDGRFFFDRTGGWLECAGETHGIVADPGSYSLAGATSITLEDVGSPGHILSFTQGADGRVSGTFDFTGGCTKGEPATRRPRWGMIDMVRVR